MSFMLKEIHEQPDVIRRMADAEQENVAKLAAEIEKRDIDLVVMAARGTSDHAAIYGKYLLEIKNSLPVALADPSVFTLYGAKLKMDRALVIGVSQSGQATDVAEYLERSKQSGALTAAITNVPGSTTDQDRRPHASVPCRPGKGRRGDQDLYIDARRALSAELVPRARCLPRQKRASGLRGGDEGGA